MMTNNSSGQYSWRPLSHEERRRHEILFFSQGPVDGFLPGEHARELFLRSKLPLHILSQIWNLVDQPQDNVLDAAEFTAAVHLIQQTMRGVPLPKDTLPPCLLPHGKRSEVRIPMMNKRELCAYRKLFELVDKNRSEHIQSERVREVLQTSGLPCSTLAQIWDLSDLDRDGKLSLDEFCIACHLTRYAKKGTIRFDGPVNIYSCLPHRMLKTDLAAKKAKMAELEDLKKRLMAIRAKKKSEAGRESERAKIWRERLEILQKRHQALREDDVGVNEFVLLMDKKKLENVTDIVQQIESTSQRLDKEQQQVRKETASVIMEAEKLSQEVRHLQNEVDKLRENRRRTSQLKDLDPFHQLFEEQKEQSESGVSTPRKQYDIHIPFKTDPFNPRKLDSPVLSGEELFNCSVSDSNSEIEEIFSQSEQKQNGSSTDPWMLDVSSSGLHQLTFGFEDSFVETWGRSDNNQNVVNEQASDVSPFDCLDFKFTDEEEPVFKTVSVTEEEDDLWSCLPDAVLATQRETMRYLQTRWAATSERLAQLDQHLNNTEQDSPTDAPECHTGPTSGSVTDLSTPNALSPCDKISNSLTTENLEYQQTSSSLDTKQSGDFISKGELCLDNRIVGDNSGVLSYSDPKSTEDLSNQEHDPGRVCERRDPDESTASSAVQIIITDSHSSDDAVSKQYTCKDLGSETLSEKSLFEKSESAADGLSSAGVNATCCETVSHHDSSQPRQGTSADVVSLRQEVDSAGPVSSAPQTTVHRSKSTSSSSELPSKGTSPKPPPRSKSLKKRRLSSRQASLDSQTSVQSYNTLKSSTRSTRGDGAPHSSSVGGSVTPHRVATHQTLTASVSDACVRCRDTSPPPRPPPRLKKLKRLSQISQSCQLGDIQFSSVEKQPVTGSVSSPVDCSVYENIHLTSDVNKNAAGTTPDRTLKDSKIVEPVREQSGKNWVCSDRVSSGNVHSVSVQNSENSFIGVGESSAHLEDGGQSDDKMDAKSRKEALEKLRSQYFGNKSQAPDPTDCGSCSDALSDMSDLISQQPMLNSGTVFVQLEAANQQSRDHSDESLYSLVKKKKDNPNTTSSSKPSKDIMDMLPGLDGSPNRHEPTPALAPVTSNDISQSNVNHGAPNVLLDIGELSGQSRMNGAFNAANDDAKGKTLPSGFSTRKNAILLDLDEIQIVPESENKITHDEGQTLAATIPVSTPGGDWEKADDSDTSEGEGNFTATFVPGAEVASEWPVAGTLRDDEETEDSGIVLVSYQQKSTSPDLLDFGSRNEAAGTRSREPDGGAPGFRESFDLLGSLGDSAEQDGPKTGLTDVTCPNFLNQNAAGNQSSGEGGLLRDTGPESAFGQSEVVTIAGDLVDLPPAGDCAAPSAYLDGPALRMSSRELVNKAGSEPTAHQPNGTTSQRIHSRDDRDVLAVGDGRGPSVTSASDGAAANRDSDSPSQVCRGKLHLDLSDRNPPPFSPNRLDPDNADSDMEQATRLIRKTSAMSPVEKAKLFVMDTEPCYRVKKKDSSGDASLPLSPEQVALSLELEHERQEILEAVRVRKKNLDNWISEFVALDSNRQKTESERKYEERKKKIGKGSHSPADEEDERLTAFEKAMREENVKSSFLLTNDTEKTSIKAKDVNDQLLEAKLVDVEIGSNQKPASKKEAIEGESVIRIVSTVKLSPDGENEKETAIEREIRLLQEREAELRLEQERRLEEQKRGGHPDESGMPIHKVPELVKVEQGKHVTKHSGNAPPLPTSPLPSGSAYSQLPEVDRDSVVLKPESIIDLEIQEQQEREKALMKAGYIRSQRIDKEAEQSEFERQEKEHERVQAHESVIEREIRIQQERERELQLLRQMVTSGAGQAAQSQAQKPQQTVQLQQHQQQQPQQKPQAKSAPQQQAVTEAKSRAAPEHNMASSPEPKVHPQLANAETVSYENALSTKSHEGESLIARELREQREREAELRQRYQEMGLGNLLHNDEPPDTPFNAPEPPQPNISKLPARAKATLKAGSASGMSRSVSEPIRIDANKEGDNHEQHESLPQSASQDVVGVETIPEEPRTPKVRPLDEPDMSDAVYKFVPQNETPIEREMRLAREREEELRRSRGYPKLVSDPGAVIEIKEVTAPVPKPHVTYKKGDEGDGKLMQKFASSRLRSEIEKEKRREQDLKQQGKISTLSSERDSGHKKYVDVIPKENLGTNKQPNWKVQNATARALSPAHSVESMDSSAQHARAEHNGAVVQQHPEPAGRPKPEPPVLRRFSSQATTEAEKQNGQPSPNWAESRIEKELREMKEREEELRNLRRSISAMRSGDSDLANNASNGELQEKAALVNTDEPKHHQSSSTVKATRRKSALAEEWERKFGASN